LVIVSKGVETVTHTADLTVSICRVPFYLVYTYILVLLR